MSGHCTLSIFFLIAKLSISSKKTPNKSAIQAKTLNLSGKRVTNSRSLFGVGDDDLQRICEDIPSCHKWLPDIMAAMRDGKCMMMTYHHCASAKRLQKNYARQSGCIKILYSRYDRNQTITSGSASRYTDWDTRIL